jgi:hypothetical protein
MIGDNADPIEGWTLPPRCCGEWAEDDHCEMCGFYVPRLSPLIELGEN